MSGLRVFYRVYGVEGFELRLRHRASAEVVKGLGPYRFQGFLGFGGS